MPTLTDAPTTSPTVYTLEAIRQVVGGRVEGHTQEPIRGVNSLELARPGELSFAEHARYLAQARQSRASALIVPTSFPALPGRALLRVEQPRVAFVRAIYLFVPPRAGDGLVHRSAVIAPDAQLGDRVCVGECAVIRPKARIGRGTIIDSGVHVGERVAIGEDCYVGPNVVILRDCRVGSRVILHGGVVIGADGFGYVWTEGRHLKIPQLGTVLIEDDVELGANVCVDRATFGATIIKRGTKVDNLVQIAHNDVIGQHVTMSGQVGLSGSVTVGDRVMFGGQSGVVDHITIGDDARVSAKTAVTRDVKPGEAVMGFPSRPVDRVKREMASLGLLPKLFERVRRLEARSKRPVSRPRPRRGPKR